MTVLTSRTSLVTLLALLAVGYSACGGGEKRTDDEPTGSEDLISLQFVANSLAELAGASDLVVIAEVRDVTREEVKLPSPVDPSFVSTRGDIVVLASVEEVVWGDAAGLTELKLQSVEWFEVPAAADGSSQGTRIDFPELPMPDRGERIVAFLRTNGGEVDPTAFAATPGFGRLDGEMVAFPTVKLDTDGPLREITIPAATLEEIREAMDRSARRAEVP